MRHVNKPTLSREAIWTLHVVCVSTSCGVCIIAGLLWSPIHIFKKLQFEAWGIHTTLHFVSCDSRSSDLQGSTHRSWKNTPLAQEWCFNHTKPVFGVFPETWRGCQLRKQCCPRKAHTLGLMHKQLCLQTKEISEKTIFRDCIEKKINRFNWGGLIALQSQQLYLTLAPYSTLNRKIAYLPCRLILCL